MNKDYGNVYSVYVLTFTDGKKYVGLTRQMPEKRWRGGSGYKNQTLVSNAIKESGGWENVKHDIVLENVSLEVGAAKEKELISKYRTQDINYGYNTKNGGQTFGEHSQEFLDSLHERMKGNTYCVGRKISEKHKQALIEGNRRSNKPRNVGRKMTDEQKEVLSKKAFERWSDPERRKVYMQAAAKRDLSGANNPMYGKKQSEETRRKISEKAIGRKLSEEVKARMRHRNTKRVLQLDLDGNVIAEYESITFAAESIHKPNTNIGFCCRNKNRTCGGYMWRYADDYS